MATEIKYDGSDQEMIDLGFITIDGVAIANKRDELHDYLKEVEKRKKYRNNKELIDAGIVDKNGKILDEKRLKEYEKQELDKRLEELDITHQKTSKAPNVWHRASAKLKQMFAKKHMPKQSNYER